MSQSIQTDNTTPHNAAQYDVNVRNTIPYYEQIHDEIINLIWFVKRDVAVWLDTGCGTGYLVENAADPSASISSRLLCRSTWNCKGESGLQRWNCYGIPVCRPVSLRLNSGGDDGNLKRPIRKNKK